VTALLNWAKISPAIGEQTVRIPRRNDSAALKAKVTLEAVRGEQPLAELATKFDVHADRAVEGLLLKGAEAVFDSGKPPLDKAADLNRLHAKIGQLTFIEVLKTHETAISMDGKGCSLDNVLIELFWRKIKYQEAYLKAYESARPRANIRRFIDFYNSIRGHTSLQGQSPDSIYFNNTGAALAA
jgi:putative transposase